MRVVIDARELCGRPTGVGRYLSGLLDAWTAASLTGGHQITLIAHQAIDAARRWPVAIKVSGGNGGTVWEQTTLNDAVNAERPDVFFAPGYTAPLRVAAPLVLTIHDVSYFAHPEWFSWREGFRRRFLTTRAARRARTVITDTDFSKAEIQRHVGVNTRVIPLGIEQTAVSLSTTNRAPVVLYVGSLFQRRRVDRLIAAFDRVVDRVPDARLEIVGENRTRPHIDFDAQVRRSRHAGRISMRSYVDDATLQQLYASASAFAFLSEYEGFGFTPLEALARGVPPLLLDTSVARETCGPAARYVAPQASDEQIAAAMVALLTDDDARGSILDARDGVLARYDWHRTGAATMSVLEEAARG